MLLHTSSRLMLVALLAVPVVGRAQSEPAPPPGCEHACHVEYQERVDRCEKTANPKACYDQAALAYKTCLAICH